MVGFYVKTHKIGWNVECIAQNINFPFHRCCVKQCTLTLNPSNQSVIVIGPHLCMCITWSGSQHWRGYWQFLSDNTSCGFIAQIAFFVGKKVYCAVSCFSYSLPFINCNFFNDIFINSMKSVTALYRFSVIQVEIWVLSASVESFWTPSFGFEDVSPVLWKAFFIFKHLVESPNFI